MDIHDISRRTLIRVSSGFVMLLISITKFTAVETWRVRYTPTWFLNFWPGDGTAIVIGTGILGIVLGIFLIFDWFSDKAALVSSILIIAVVIMMATQALINADVLYLADIIRNIGLAGLFVATYISERQERVAYLDRKRWWWVEN